MHCYRLSGECTTGVFQHLASATMEMLSVNRIGKTGDLPGGLFALATINFSVFPRVMISLSAIYNKYASHHLILTFYV